MHVFVVNVDWGDLQPSSTKDSCDDAPPPPGCALIDTALMTAKAHNLQVKLRVYAGNRSPMWAKTLGGAPMTLVDPAFPKQGTDANVIPRFWTAQFGDAYDALQAMLAARDDTDSALRQVDVSPCSTYSPETMIRGIAGAGNPAAYAGAGYTVTADAGQFDVAGNLVTKGCLQEQLASHAKHWKQTRTGIAYNPYQWVNPATLGTFVDESYTEYLMQYCRDTLGDRCVLQNFSLRDPVPAGGAPSGLTSEYFMPGTTAPAARVIPGSAGAYLGLYAALAASGPPLAFQTAVPSKIGTWRDALDFAAATTFGAYGGAEKANLVELLDNQSGYLATYPLPHDATGPGLASYSALYATQPTQ